MVMKMDLQIFGGRGSSSGLGGGGVATSNRIKREMLDKGLNSRFKGVQRDAKAGTGNYTFKDAKAVSSTDAMQMTVYKHHEANGNTLFEGTLRGKKVFYANKNSDSTVQKINSKLDKQREKQINESKVRPEIRTTSTYDRWKKNHDKNLAAWFGEDRLK